MTAFLEALLEPYGGRASAVLRALARYLIEPGYRVMTKVRHVNLTSGRWSRWLSARLSLKHPIVYSARARAGKGLSIPHCQGVVVGRDVVIGEGCTIYQQVTLGQSHGRFPTLGDGVIVYAGAKVVGGVHVGDRAVVGANSVVTKDVPVGAVVAGNPARIVRHRDAGRDADLL